MKIRSLAGAALLMIIGVSAGYAAGRIRSEVYRGKEKAEAGRALLDQARLQAGKGSWERIAVARVYYLAGMKAEGQAIIDDVMARKPESSDVFRVARIYREAGEWEKARELFERYLRTNPKDDKALAEVGAYYMLNGDRDRAEELFERSFALESELWATISAAGSYFGVEPQE
jgi:tetratricopeptide (TPR) repeat protein